MDGFAVLAEQSAAINLVDLPKMMDATCFQKASGS
jgi:hypothetical protein